MDKKLNKYFREILSHLKKLKNSVNFKTVRREFAHDWIKEISIELLYISIFTDIVPQFNCIAKEHPLHALGT